MGVDPISILNLSKLECISSEERVEETAKHTSVGPALPADETKKDTKMRFGSYADAVKLGKD